MPQPLHRGGQGIGIQPGELGLSNRVARVEQKGEDDRLGAQRITHGLRERGGNRFLQVRSIVDVGLIDGPHPRDGRRGGQAHHARTYPGIER